MRGLPARAVRGFVARHRWFVLAVLALVVAVAVWRPHGDRQPAHEPRGGPDRIQLALLIAERKWGPACGGQVTVRRAELPAGRLAQASYRFPFGAADDPAAYFGCVIEIRGGRVPWRRFCWAVALHEYGHLAGWRAPPGQQVVWPDGTNDAHHSRNPRSVMFPRYLGHSDERCDRELRRRAD